MAEPSSAREDHGDDTDFCTLNWVTTFPEFLRFSVDRLFETDRILHGRMPRCMVTYSVHLLGSNAVAQNGIDRRCNASFVVIELVRFQSYCVSCCIV